MFVKLSICRDKRAFVRVILRYERTNARLSRQIDNFGGFLRTYFRCPYHTENTSYAVLIATVHGLLQKAKVILDYGIVVMPSPILHYTGWVIIHPCSW